MTLFLFPNVLGPTREHHLYLPASVDVAVTSIDGLIAESEGEGRRFLKRFPTKKKPHEMPIALLTKTRQEIDFLLEPLLKGERWGVISDCGLPCLADPGAFLVRRAHQLKIPVKAFAGPSSITHALMLSGLSGQAFSFHGYIAKDPAKRVQELRQWEHTKGVTHLFIEAPYRNQHTLQAAINTLQDNTLFCIACSLTTDDEWIRTDPISVWKKSDMRQANFLIEKKPAIFLLYKNSDASI